jgi:hypothetical protein
MQLKSVAFCGLVLVFESQDSGRIDVYTRPTEPRSIGGVLDDGLKLWRESLPKTWPLAVLAQLSVALPLLLLASKFPGLVPATPTSAFSPASAANAQAMLALIKSPTTWLAYVLILILSVTCYAAIVLRIAGVAAATVDSLGGSLMSALRLLPKLLLQFLLFFVAMMGAGIAFALLVGIGSAIGGRGAVTAIMSIVVFFVFAFIFGRVFFASMLLMLEDAGPAESIGISWRLTRGYWWRCAGLLLVLIIIGLVFTLVVGFVAAAIGAVLGAGVLGTGVSQLVSLLANAVLGSLYPAVLIAILYDLKLRKQGGDLLGRVDALAR